MTGIRHASLVLARAATRASLLAALAFAAPATAARGPQAGPVADAAAVLRRHPLRTLSGETLDLAAMRGDVVVVNFWASWCPPCRRELPELDALHREIQARGGRVVAVSIDHDPRHAARFVARHKLSLPVAHDGPDGLAKALALPAVPYTLVLDRSGRVAHATRASDAAALGQLAATTRRLLDAKPLVTHTEDPTR